jgi:nitrogen fixation NifU-like protein
MSDDLYHQQILDIYRNPPHFGKLKNPDAVITETNSSCGDSFTFYLKFSPDKKTFQKITFTGTGCAISTASCSLLIDHLITQPISVVKKIDQSFMEQLIGTKITPARHKCLILSQMALNQLLNSA